MAKEETTMTKSVHSTIAFVACFIASAIPAEAWIPHISNTAHCYPKSSSLCVLSEEISESESTEEKVPYAIARGDGSTGGGGLPMPQKQKLEDDDEEETEELRRPKVNAEMPQG